MVGSQAGLERGVHEDLPVGRDLENRTAPIADEKVSLTVKGNPGGNAHAFGVQRHLSCRRNSMHIAFVARRNVNIPGPVGGELAIVNRWRDQIGLSATDERGLASSRSSVQSKAGTISVYDFSSEGAKRSRLIAALLRSHESIWFVKMLGEEAALASARPKFMHLLESLRFDAAN